MRGAAQSVRAAEALKIAGVAARALGCGGEAARDPAFDLAERQPRIRDRASDIYWRRRQGAQSTFALRLPFASRMIDAGALLRGGGGDVAFDGGEIASVCCGPPGGRVGARAGAHVQTSRQRFRIKIEFRLERHHTPPMPAIARTAPFSKRLSVRGRGAYETPWKICRSF